MAWNHLSITGPHLAYIILGGFTSLFMLCSSVIKERMYIGEATVATLCGVIFGPYAANLINPDSWGAADIVTIEFSRIVLVVQCFAVGVELPKYYMEKHWKSVTFLLVPVMVFGWLITSLVIWWLIKPLTFLESLVIAACVTPTDPVLASSVVGKGKFAKRVPKHLRDLLSAESGCNDGMAFPFVYLALYLIQDHQSAGQVTYHWIVYTILYECIFGAVYGFVIGYLARHGIKYAEKHELIDRESFLVFYFVLALFCAGSGSILGIDDLLVGFAAGVGFSNDGWFTQKTEESHVSNVIDLLLNLAYFVYFGTIIPWSAFNNPAIGRQDGQDFGLQAWKLVVLAIFVLLFRRIPIMLVLKPVISDLKTWREALFAGHFGPMGVGAIFIAMLARAEMEHGAAVPLAKLPPMSEHYALIALVWPIVAFIVVTSIIVHGSSVAVFTLGKHINTLTITMSYTQATEEGPSWLNRLPRITSQSRSQARTMSDTDVEELKTPDFPPGTLPPIGLPGNFLRRVREEDNTPHGSRASSLAARRRRKRWDDGIGPGGPISQSAIFPQRRSQNDQQPPALPRDSTDQLRPEEPQALEPTPPSEVVRLGSPKDREPDRTSAEQAAVKPAAASAAAEASPSTTQEDRGPAEVYDEGDHVVVENQEGDVLAVQPSNPEEVAEQARILASKLKAEAGPSGWTYEALKKRVTNWREAEIAKRKEKDKMGKKREPARAYQFGNTIIVENEDGEVVKKYEIPTDKRQPDLVSQGLKYMGMGVFAKRADRDNIGTNAEASGAGGGSSSGVGGQAAAKSSAQKPSRKGLVKEQQEEDDRHIRFTVGGVGRRMTKEDFIKEMQKLDKTTRREVVDKSTATQAVKALARQDPQSQMGEQASGPSSRTAGSRQGPAATGASGSGSQSPSRSPSPEEEQTTAEVPSKEVPETEVERRRRLAVLKDLGEASEDAVETAAERRRREAALGMGSHGAEEDSDDDDTPRVPPSRRAIRFADAPDRGRRAA
ncbi:hypothetical protein VTK56DRAFT_6888 [Thermocarpiscus australiensis]